MKILIIFFMICFTCEKFQAQSNGYLNITGLQINQLSNSKIKVNLKVHSAILVDYNSFISEINGNIITLKACYNIFIGQMASNLENDFEIDIPPAPGNYIFNVEVYGADFGVCIYDNVHLQDSASLNFTNPFNGTISLSTTDSDGKDRNVNLYPNPVKDILHFSQEVSEIKITDLSGKTVKLINGSVKSINIATLPKGVYILTATLKSGSTIHRKIIKE